jgi:excisionase family DNA binding protein
VTNPICQDSIGSEWCNIKAAAAHLGVSVAFLRKLVRLEKVPFARVGSTAVRFRLSELDRWVETNGCDGVWRSDK